jgi:hypothetical protein
MTRRQHGVRTVLAAFSLVLLLAGCGSDGTTATPTRSPTNASTTAAPTFEPGLAGVAGDPRAGLTGQLLQFRRDVARRRVEVRIVAANDGLLVDGLTVRAPGLDLRRDRPVEASLREGAGLDLPVVMGEPDCWVQPGAAVAVLSLGDATGARRTVEVPLADDGLLGRLHAGDCADRALRAQADLRVVAVEPVQTPDGPALRLDIRLTRLSGTDPVRIAGARPNTIYTVTPVGSLPTLREGTETLVVDMLPSRCDPHGLGESYRTSLIDLVVALGDADPRPYTLTPEDAVRRRLETFAVDTCHAGD